MKHPIPPMLALKSPVPDVDTDDWPRLFDQPGWIFEPKLDGVRAIVTREGQRVTIQSRQGNDITGQYPEIVDSVKSMFGNFTLDGEVVMLDANGKSTFHGLQNHRTGDRSRLRFMAFDCLALSHDDLMKLPLSERRQMLHELMVPRDHVKAVPAYTDGKTLWRLALEEQWEGIIAKPVHSIYVPDGRSAWLKMKRNVRDDFAVIGYTAGTGHRTGTIGALVLAQKRSGDLVYAGKCGTGFDRMTLAALLPQLDRLKTTTPPVTNAQAVRVRLHLDGKVITWTKPDLTVRVEFNDYAGPERVVRMGAYKGVVQ